MSYLGVLPDWRKRSERLLSGRIVPSSGTRRFSGRAWRIRNSLPAAATALAAVTFSHRKLLSEAFGLPSDVLAGRDTHVATE